jgi:hypothetical protein
MRDWVKRLANNKLMRMSEIKCRIREMKGFDGYEVLCSMIDGGMK